MWGIIVLGGAVIVITVWAGALCAVDLRHRRLPDRLTLPAALGAGLGAASLQPALLLGGLGWAGLYVLVGLREGGIGGGDIKLALSLGIVVAAAGGVSAWFGAVLGASLLTVLVGVVTRSPSLPHGPAMIVAAAASVVLSQLGG